MKYLLLSLLIFATSALGEPPVKVGVILHLTGDLAMVANAFREGIELAAEELNADAIRYTLIVEDGHNSPKSSHSAAQKLIRMDKIDVAILSSHLDVMSGGKLLEREKIPSICIWDSNPEIDDAGEYIFAIGPWTPSAGEEASRFALERLHGKRAVVFYNADFWSESVTRSFTKDFERRGGKILDSILLNPQDNDFRAVITRARSLNPDFIYTPLVFNLVPFYSQLHQLEFPGPIVTSDIIAEEHISKAPEAFEGIYQTGIADPTSEQFNQMAAAYEKKFAKKLSLPWFVAVGYDSMQLINKAVKSSGKAGISQGLYQIKGHKGASAELSINDKGTAPQMEVMFRIEGGKLKRINTAE